MKKKNTIPFRLLFFLPSEETSVLSSHQEATPSNIKPYLTAFFLIPGTFSSRL